MVEYTAGGDTYWRTDTNNTLHKKTTKAALKTELGRAGSKFKKSITKAELWETKQRLDKGLISYAACSVKELRGFVEARGILTTDNKCSTRSSLTTKLIAADRSPRFNGLFALPAELRVRIYEYSMSSFPKRLRTPAEPPLARTCRQLRNEVLPIFYSTFTIELTFLRPNPTSNCHPDDDTTRFLSSISPENLAAIRSVYLNVSDILSRHHRVGAEFTILAGSILLELNDQPEILVSDGVQYRGKGRWNARNMTKQKIPVELQGFIDNIREVGGRKRLTLQVFKALCAIAGAIF
ncbi:hypothetical protein LTR37_017331 [Vermiconidia calcicola]|uniref:Uncharacterized protein n=1 Tax=Vermiconidia calcicola TaxID=1690605 RepID=A0ACC3MKB7_9PEZI|nr:hypothetical protein LTR37_017331 [Vermiconidia calcicola]